MKHKKLLIKIGLVLAAGAVLYIGARVAVIHALASVDLNVKPFVATIQHTVTVNGKTVKTADEVVARARSGGIVHIYTAYNADGKVVLNRARKIEKPNGFVAMVYDQMKAKATGQRTAITLAQSKAALENVTSDCVERGQASREIFDGEETLLGQKAMKVKAEQNGLRRTVWRLPDFNCKVIQSEIVVPAHGSTPGETLFAKLVSFTPVDPPENLFTIDYGYKEMPPSQLVREVTGKPDVPVSAKEKAADKNYADANK